MSPKRYRLIALIVAAVGIAAAVAFAASFPAVEGLGTKVRLPVFHGAMTWVNLASFTLMGLLAVVSLVKPGGRAYRWEEAFRLVAVPMWLLGSALGLMAALNTWDFTGSKSSRLSIVTADPRLMAQFWILLAGLALLAFALLIDERRWLSALDLGFVVLMWAVLLRAVLGPGRALHPDSPVLNSEEIFIKLMFLGIVVSLGIAAIALAAAIASLRGGADTKLSNGS